MKTALLVIDVQKVYTDAESDLCCKQAATTVKRINDLIEKFQKANAPIYLIRHIHKTDGSDLGRMFDFTGEAEEDFNFKEGSEEVEYDDGLIKPKNAFEIIKNRYSALEGTKLDSMLKKEGIKKVVICGFMTNFCCESTARSAHDKDYYIDLIIDATGTPGTENFDQTKIRKYVTDCMEAGIARVMTTKNYLKENQT
jgi:ureidoacrylate peracid hydrolase